MSYPRLPSLASLPKLSRLSKPWSYHSTKYLKTTIQNSLIIQNNFQNTITQKLIMKYEIWKYATPLYQKNSKFQEILEYPMKAHFEAFNTTCKCLKSEFHHNFNICWSQKNKNNNKAILKTSSTTMLAVKKSYRICLRRKFRL